MDCAYATTGTRTCPPAHVVVSPTTVAGATVSYDSGWYTAPVPNAYATYDEVRDVAVTPVICPYGEPYCWYPPDR
jgi:hypothetical protein